MTVVTRESEWDEVSVSRAIELHRYESGACPCGCGQQIDEATDTTRAFVVQEHVCQARRALNRHEKAEKAKAEERKAPEDWDAGLTYYIGDSFVLDPKGGGTRGN